MGKPFSPGARKERGNKIKTLETRLPPPPD